MATACEGYWTLDTSRTTTSRSCIRLLHLISESGVALSRFRSADSFFKSSSIAFAFAAFLFDDSITSANSLLMAVEADHGTAKEAEDESVRRE